MENVVRRFRELATNENRGKDRRSYRYSPELHEMGAAYARRQRQSGTSMLTIARELGVRPVTVGRWIEGPRRPGLRPVRVAQDPPNPDARASLTLTTPSGCRIEGLDLESIVDLIRRLG